MRAFAAKRAITPKGVLEDVLVVVERGKIAAIESREAETLVDDMIDLGAATLCGGYIDLHVHGSAGVDLMHADASELQRFETFLAKHGVTGYLATTVTAPEDDILHSLERLATFAEAPPEPGRARMLGIHLEGPFISHNKRGVHPPECLRAADIQLFDRFFDAAQGKIKMVTFAPELEGAAAFIRHLSERGVRVSLGHSDATWNDAQAGILAGAVSATHTFNAMRALDHRDPGILGAVLTNADLMADIIADGVHVHPAMVKMFLSLKGDDHAILITDAISATGMGDGRYRLGPFEVEVKGDRCEHDGKLAGSVLTLDRAVRNVADFSHCGIERATRLASRNPARLLGLAELGALAEGARADLTVLDRQANVVGTIHNGELVLNES